MSFNKYSLQISLADSQERDKESSASSDLFNTNINPAEFHSTHVNLIVRPQTTAVVPMTQSNRKSLELLHL